MENFICKFVVFSLRVQTHQMVLSYIDHVARGSQLLTDCRFPYYAGFLVSRHSYHYAESGAFQFL